MIYNCELDYLAALIRREQVARLTAAR